MKLNLLEFFRNLEDEVYCIIKYSDITKYKEGSDIDIFCYNLKSYSKKILEVANNYVSQDFSINVSNNHVKHWHIDIMQNNKIEIRFDLYETMPSYRNILVKEALFSSIIENSVVMNVEEIKVYVPSVVDETIIRYLEYIENYQLRPDKVKHLNYILDNIEDEKDNKKFLDKLHFYTKIPQILEVKKSNPFITFFSIVEEIKIKIKMTPINELPQKSIGFLKKRFFK